MSTHRVPGFVVPAPGSLVRVVVDGRVLAVTLAGGRVLALDDACPHLRSSLAAGVVQDGVLVCPRHLARFDVATGAVLSGPPTTGVRTYRAALSGTDLTVELPD